MRMPKDHSPGLVSRREFLGSAAAAAAMGLATERPSAQEPGDRPQQAAQVTVLNPGTRVPVGLIIDDSTCLVNLNRFAMPQFDETFGGKNKAYARDWRSWPVEIPDSFVRKFGTWCAEHGVKGNTRLSRIRPASDAWIAAFLAGPAASSTTAWHWCAR